MKTIALAVLVGMGIAMLGTIPRNILFFANLQYFTSVPWAVPLIAAYIGWFWRYLGGAGPPAATAGQRRERLRANRVAPRAWIWALLAGGLGIAALVLGLRLANRMILLPAQELPDLSQVPRLTMVSLLLLSAPVAGIIEEAAFRGYMQGPIERRYGLPAAILITGTMFAVAHLDFTLVLWPYYVAVAAIYGTVTYLTNSTVPAVVLHTAGNLYSNFDLWLHGQAEWQAGAAPASLIWETGTDPSFWLAGAALLVASAATVWAYCGLAAATRENRAANGGIGARLAVSSR
jgi:membrane protease YdiL (CAAX protease family)